MASSVKPSNQIGRREHDLLVDLGYTPKGMGGGGHYRYTHPAAEDYFVSGTAYDGMAWRKFLSDMRRRHPDAFQQARSERRTTKTQRRAKARRRETRPTVPITLNGNGNGQHPEPETVGVPNPGSPEAVAEGCVCPRFENRHGVGVEGDPGIFVQVKHCSLHGWADEPEPDDGPMCACGNPIRQSGRGRPRKWCLSCRPSQWGRMSEKQRQALREQNTRSYWRKRSSNEQETV